MGFQKEKIINKNTNMILKKLLITILCLCFICMSRLALGAERMPNEAESKAWLIEWIINEKANWQFDKDFNDYHIRVGCLGNVFIILSLDITKHNPEHEKLWAFAKEISQAITKDYISWLHDIDVIETYRLKKLNSVTCIFSTSKTISKTETISRTLMSYNLQIDKSEGMWLDINGRPTYNNDEND